MAEVEHKVQTPQEGDEHFCTGCNSWHAGLSMDEKVVYIEYMEDFITPVEDFNIDDFTKTRRTAACGCQVVLDAGWDENIVDVVVGDPIFVCTECDSSYPEEDMASNCC